MGFNPERLFGDIQQSVHDSEKRALVVEKCRTAVTRILDWARSSNVNVTNITRLGGGFVNLVLLIETSDGKAYVAKAFNDQAEAQTTRVAQKTFDRISENDLEFIPEAIAWIEDDLLISAQAEGIPIKTMLVRMKTGETSLESVESAFYHLGHLLGHLHEKTQSHYGGKDETGSFDADEILKEFARPETQSFIASRYTPIQIEQVRNTIYALTDKKHLTVVHGDTHLDQFFIAPDKSLVTIVDFDSLRHGDPMFDVARTLASLRSWCAQLDITHEETALTNATINGYRDARNNDLAPNDKEFSYARVLAYELRLYAVQLRSLPKQGALTTSTQYQQALRAFTNTVDYLLSLA